jgi:hypothetical protein
MTDYHLKPPADALPSTAWQEKKQARKKLLDEIRRRRGQRYMKFMEKLQKRQLQPSGDLL